MIGINIKGIKVFDENLQYLQFIFNVIIPQLITLKMIYIAISQIKIHIFGLLT